MTGCSPTFPPFGAAFQQWATRVIDVILHVGAHGTGIKSIHDYLRRHKEHLASLNICARMPQGGCANPPYSPDLSDVAMEDTTADGTDSGLSQFVAGRQSRFDKLIVSNEDLIGTLPENVEAGALYPEAGNRLAGFVQNLGLRASTVLVSPLSHRRRSLSAWAVGTPLRMKSMQPCGKCMPTI